eukprot:31003-Pelagococcus_subviridis.AAC.9
MLSSSATRSSFSALIAALGPFHTSERRGGVERQNRRAKSLRNGVHHANGVIWEPVYRTRLHRGDLAQRDDVEGVLVPSLRAPQLRHRARDVRESSLADAPLAVHLLLQPQHVLADASEARSVRANVGTRESEGVGRS